MPRIIGYVFGHDFTPEGPDSPETVLILHLEGGDPSDPIRFGIPDRAQAALVAGILGLPNLEWDHSTKAIIARSAPPVVINAAIPAKATKAKPTKVAKAGKPAMPTKPKAKAKKGRAKSR